MKLTRRQIRSLIENVLIEGKEKPIDVAILADYIVDDISTRKELSNVLEKLNDAEKEAIANAMALKKKDIGSNLSADYYKEELKKYLKGAIKSIKYQIHPKNKKYGLILITVSDSFSTPFKSLSKIIESSITDQIISKGKIKAKAIQTKDDMGDFRQTLSFSGNEFVFLVKKKELFR